MKYEKRLKEVESKYGTRPRIPMGHGDKFFDTHFRGETSDGQLFVYCPEGFIISWSVGDYENKWCHWCQMYYEREHTKAPLNIPYPENKYGSHTIPEEWKRIDDVYIWFQDMKHDDGHRWDAIKGYLYETTEGKYMAPFRGDLIEVVHDTKDEYREIDDEAI